MTILSEATMKFFVRARGAKMNHRVLDQKIPLSGGGMQIFHQPNPDDAFTAIKFIGTNSTVSYFIAGDAS